MHGLRRTPLGAARILLVCGNGERVFVFYGCLLRRSAVTVTVDVDVRKVRGEIPLHTVGGGGGGGGGEAKMDQWKDGHDAFERYLASGTQIYHNTESLHMRAMLAYSRILYSPLCRDNTRDKSIYYL